MTYLYILLAAAAGAMLPLQAGVNNSLRAAIGNPVLAALVSFAVGAFCLLAFVAVVRVPWPPLQTASRLPAWIWMGGLLGATHVAIAIYLAPRLGAANLISLMVAAQLFMSLALDHYGAVGFAQHGINAWRLAGALLLICGSVLIVRN